MVVSVNPVYPVAGVPSEAFLAKIEKGMAGPAGMGFAESGGGYWQGLLQTGVNRTFDLLQSVYTPPTYQSTGPSGTTTVRTSQPPYTPTYSGSGVPTPTGGMSASTMALIGAGLVLLVVAMKR